MPRKRGGASGLNEFGKDECGHNAVLAAHIAVAFGLVRLHACGRAAVHADGWCDGIADTSEQHLLDGRAFGLSEFLKLAVRPEESRASFDGCYFALAFRIGAQRATSDLT